MTPTPDLQHNIVSMLYTIKGVIETHFSRYEEKHFAAGDEALQHAHTAMNKAYAQAERALQITKKIRMAMKSLDVGESGGEASVRDVWFEVLGLLRGIYPLDQLTIINHIPENFPKIYCNALELLEIFYCLTENAIQACQSSEGESKLILRAHLGISAQEQLTAYLTLADTGPGIPSETLVRLFEPFVTTKPVGQGNGLGLCLVRGLVRKNAGTISLTSFRGCGTTVSLAFPAQGHLRAA